MIFALAIDLGAVADTQGGHLHYTEYKARYASSSSLIRLAGGFNNAYQMWRLQNRVAREWSAVKS
jgi:hypothetical protein